MDEDKGVRVYTDGGETFIEGYWVCVKCDRDYHYVLPAILAVVLPDLCWDCCDYGAMVELMRIRLWEL